MFVAFVLSVRVDNSPSTSSHTVTLYMCVLVLALVRTDHHTTFPTPIKKSLSVHSESSTYLWLANCNHTLWLALIMWLSQRNWLQMKEESDAMGKPPTWAVWTLSLTPLHSCGLHFRTYSRSRNLSIVRSDHTVWRGNCFHLKWHREDKGFYHPRCLSQSKEPCLWDIHIAVLWRVVVLVHTHARTKRKNLFLVLLCWHIYISFLGKGIFRTTELCNSQIGDVPQPLNINIQF